MNPMMEPIFFTPPRAADGRMPLFKGGGGGQVYYENQDKLLGVQADIASNMYNQYAQKGAPLLASLADKAAAGVDPDKYAGQAAADVQNANANERDTMIRSAARMGMNPASGNMQSLMADNALRSAANTAGAANKARRDADGLDWARRSDVASMYSGMPGQATQSLSSAASGYGQMAGQQNQMAMANAQGYGAMGASLGKALFAKDGGYIKGRGSRAAKRGLKFAAGGMAQLGDWRQRPSGVRQIGGQSAVGSIVSGMAPTVMGEVAKPYIKEAMSPIRDGVSRVLGDISGTAKAAGETVANAAREAVGQAPTHVFTATPAEAAIDAGALGAGEGVGSAAAGAEAVTGAATGAEAATGAAAATEAAAGAGAGALGTVGAAVPWIGGAMLLASALDLFADGGEVEGRKDMTAGGRVSGPGSETSDDIPAWLSDGEYVLNAEAVRMVGKKKLDAINQKGLAARGDQGGSPGAGARAAKDGAARFFLGGMAGVAMGAGVDQWNRMEQMDLAKKADARADAAQAMQREQHQRAGERHGIEMDALRISADEQKAVRDHMRKMQGDIAAIQSGDMSPIGALAEQYSRQAPGFNNGYTAALQSAPDGGTLVNHMNSRGEVVDSIPLNSENALQLYMKGAQAQLSAISPKFLEKAVDYGNQMERTNTEIRARKEENAADRELRSRLAELQERGANRRHGASLGQQQQQLGLARERWAIEKGDLEARAAESAAVRAARHGLMTALDSGDTAAIEKAKAKAVAAGIKFEKPNNEFVSTTDSMGLNVTRTNKDTGQVDIINPKTGEVRTIPAPGGGTQKSGIPMPKTDDEFKQIPKGARYIDPDDGRTYIKP